jgi:hypothetical protein
VPKSGLRLAEPRRSSIVIRCCPERSGERASERPQLSRHG